MKHPPSDTGPHQQLFSGLYTLLSVLYCVAYLMICWLLLLLDSHACNSNYLKLQFTQIMK